MSEAATASSSMLRGPFSDPNGLGELENDGIHEWSPNHLDLGKGR